MMFLDFLFQPLAGHSRIGHTGPVSGPMAEWSNAFPSQGEADVVSAIEGSNPSRVSEAGWDHHYHPL